MSDEWLEVPYFLRNQETLVVELRTEIERLQADYATLLERWKEEQRRRIEAEKNDGAFGKQVWCEKEGCNFGMRITSDQPFEVSDPWLCPKHGNDRPLSFYEKR